MADNENLKKEGAVDDNSVSENSSAVVQEEPVQNAEQESPAKTENKDTAAKDDAKKSKADAKGKKKTEKKGFFKRIGASLKKFWKIMKSELKKVVWYSRKQTFTSTLLVLVVMAVSAVVIGLVDLGLSKGLEFIANLV